MGQAACREGLCSCGPGGADAFSETCEVESFNGEHTEADSDATPCLVRSCKSGPCQLSVVETTEIEAIEVPKLVEALLFDEHPGDHLVSQRPCIQPNEDIDGSKRWLHVDFDDYVDDVDMANLDRMIAQGIGMDTCGPDRSRDSLDADESIAPGSFFGSKQARILSLPSSETDLTEEFTALQARAVAKPAFDTCFAEEVTISAEMVRANNEGLDASLCCESDAHPCVKEKIQIEHANLEKDSAKTSSVTTLSFQPETEPESQPDFQLEMQTKHAEMVSETDPAASKIVELPGFEANIKGLGNETLVPFSRQVTTDGLSRECSVAFSRQVTTDVESCGGLETDCGEDENEVDFAIGDVVMLVGHGVPREHLYHAAIITKLDESHCTVIVLDDSRSFGIGECWPSFVDMELETEGLRLGTRVVVSGMQRARTRHLNTLTGVISMHPRQGHPTFIKKPSCPDHAKLTVCVVFDDAVAAKERSALLEPRFLASFDDTVLQLTQDLMETADILKRSVKRRRTGCSTKSTCSRRSQRSSASGCTKTISHANAPS